jgi:methylmalonyl-CoA/ethylmalonyl-CoA epimerase
MKKVDHIGIAVSSLEDRVPFYRDVLGLEDAGREEVPEQMVRTAMFRAGEVRIELLEPTSRESPVAKFIEKKGEGIHHIAYETEDLRGTLAALKGQDIRLIDEEPRKGAGGMQIAFIHPKSSGKVLTEICQPGSGS